MLEGHLRSVAAKIARGEHRGFTGMTFTLPYPPSVNTYWRMARGRMILSDKGRAYRLLAAASLAKQGIEKAKCPVRVSFDVYVPDLRRRDLDNVMKAMFDVLVQCGLVGDDDWRHIPQFSVTYMAVDRDNPRVEVDIESKETPNE
jgi:crossover junction endodeoxyribonuclease RusA